MKKLNPGWKLLSLILASLLLSATFRIRLNLVVAALPSPCARRGWTGGGLDCPWFPSFWLPLACSPPDSGSAQTEEPEA